VLPSSTVDTSYKVKANVTLPASFSIAGSSPAGGLRLRIRAPLAHAGKLSAVTVGGKPWTNFDASTETVDFKVSDLTSEMLSVGLPMIVVEFSADTAVPLKRAVVDFTHKVVPKPACISMNEPQSRTNSDKDQENGDGLGSPDCPLGTTLLNSFKINSTAWSACEDLQNPEGALVIVSR
jgi:hypothetical protein